MAGRSQKSQNASEKKSCCKMFIKSEINACHCKSRVQQRCSHSIAFVV